jgi:hypothetical protein
MSAQISGVALNPQNLVPYDLYVSTLSYTSSMTPQYQQISSGSYTVYIQPNSDLFMTTTDRGSLSTGYFSYSTATQALFGSSNSQFLFQNKGDYINYPLVSRFSPFNSSTYGVAWNGTIWVACGQGINTIATSVDGISWIPRDRGIIFTTYAYAAAWSPNLGLWVVVGNSGGTSSTNVAATSPDGITWTGVPGFITSAANAPLRKGCWAYNPTGTLGSIYVIGELGANSRIYTSADGSNWAFRSIPVSTAYNVGWNGNLFIATTSNTTVMTSPDAITWTSRGLAPNITNTYGIAYSPAWGVWIMCGFYNSATAGGAIQFSYDGINWNYTTMNVANNTAGLVLYDVQWNPTNNYFQIVGSNAYMYQISSSSTLSNIPQTFPSATFNNIWQTAWSPTLGLWAGVGSGTYSIASSTDGVNWTGRSTAFSTAGYGVAWNGSYFVAVGQGTNTIALSSNGTTWTAYASNASNYTSAGYGVIWSSNLSTWVATGQAATGAGGGGTGFTTSPDGVTWTQRGSAGCDNYGITVQWNPLLNQFLMGGVGNHSLATSSDGVLWQGRTGLAIFSGQVNGVIFSPQLGLWCAVGSGTNTVATSQDGINWIGRSSGVNSSGNAITWSPQLGLFVMGGSGTYQIATSQDGITWTSQTSAITSLVYGLAWSSNLSLFVAVGNGSYTAATSPTGVTWTGRTGLFTSIGYAVTWNPQLLQFVAGGTGTTYNLTTSADGISWIGTSNINNLMTNVYCVAWGGQVWVAGGTGTNTLCSSVDGVAWTGRGAAVITTAVWGVAFNFSHQSSANGAMWMAVGTGTNVFASSPDGATWTGRTTGATLTTGYGIVFYPPSGLWVATGAGGINISGNNGSNWASQTTSNASYGVSSALGTGYGLAFSTQTYGSNITISGATFSSPASGQVTYTVASTFGLFVGSVVTIAGFVNTGYNGSFTILGIALNTSFYVANTTVLATTNNSPIVTTLPNVAITAQSGSGNVTTYSVANTYGITVGSFVTIYCVAYFPFNGTFQVTSVNPNTSFSVGSNSAGASYGNYGSAYGPIVTFVMPLVVAVGSGGLACTSIDGYIWTARATSLTTCYGIAWSPNLQRFSIVGQGGNSSVYSGITATTWSNMSSNIFPGGQGNGITWNGTLYTAASSGTYSESVSYDGINWTGILATPGVATTQCVAYRPQIMVAGISSNYGSYAAPNVIIYSQDGGNTWQGRSGNTIMTQCYAVAWNGLIWVAVGTGGTRSAWSSDGINWTGTTNAITTTVYCLVWANSLGLWVAGGYGSFVLSTSVDGVTWTGRAGSSTLAATIFGGPASYGCIALGWNGIMLVALGSLGANNLLATSRDGINWYGQGTPTGFSNATLSYGNGGVAWNGNLWCVGNKGMTYPVTSPDGITWTQRTSGFTASSITTIIWNGRLFGALTGTTTTYLQVSPDGVNWTSATPNITNFNTSNLALSFNPNANAWYIGGLDTSTSYYSLIVNSNANPVTTNVWSLLLSGATTQFQSGSNGSTAYFGYRGIAWHPLCNVWAASPWYRNQSTAMYMISSSNAGGWITRTNVYLSGNSVATTFIAYNATNGYFLMGTATGLSYSTNNAWIYYSADGINWYTANAVTGVIGWTCAVWSTASNVWVLGGIASSTATSSNYSVIYSTTSTNAGTGYTLRSSAVLGVYNTNQTLSYNWNSTSPYALSTVYPYNLFTYTTATSYSAASSNLDQPGCYCLAWSPQLNIFIAGGGMGVAAWSTSFNSVAPWTAGTANYSQSNCILTSSDGFTWNNQGTTNMPQQVYAACWAYGSNFNSGSGFFIIGGCFFTTSQPVISYSANGTSWSSALLTSNIFTNVFGLAANSNVAVAVGMGTLGFTIAWSSNAINWYGVPNSSNLFFAAGFNVAWNGSYFCAVGSNSGSGAGAGNHIATSPDGINWATRYTTTMHGVSALAFQGPREKVYTISNAQWTGRTSQQTFRVLG